MLTAQNKMIKVAQALLYKHDEEHTTKVTNPLTELSAGSYVLLLCPEGVNGRAQAPSKLQHRWQGPFQVVKHSGSDYWLRDTVSNRERKRPVHISRLKEFVYDASRTDPKEIAAQSVQEWAIQEIVGHDGQESRSKRPQSFEVRWAGFGAEEDTWEPWNNLRDTRQLHQYLAANGMERFIPKRFQRDDYDIQDEDE